jgi:hypothetical protein
MTAAAVLQRRSMIDVVRRGPTSLPASPPRCVPQNFVRLGTGTILVGLRLLDKRSGQPRYVSENCARLVGVRVDA